MSNITKIILMVLVGVILLGVGVFTSIYLIQQYQAAQAPPIPEQEIITSPVVTTNRDLPLGTRLTNDDLAITDIPTDFIPRTAISSLEDAVGKINKTDLVQGEMVLMHNLADPTNTNKDLSFILSDDHVMMAFPGNDIMSIEGIIQRGDIVDIFATITQQMDPPQQTWSEEEQPEPEIRTFTINTMQRVSITALVLDTPQTNQVEGQDMSQGDEPSQPQTNRDRIDAYLLALNPQDALILKHLKDTGAMFDIVLRAPTSTEPFDLTPVTEQYIIELYRLDLLP